MGQLTVDLSTKVETLKTKEQKQNRTGVAFPRYFTARQDAGKTPYDEVQWETRTASIGNDKGAVIFEQRDIEVPVDWSQTATNIVASKYFHGKLGAPERETSVAQLVQRVVDTIAGWGLKDGYFATADKLGGETLAKTLLKRPKACFSCIISCGRVTKVINKQFAGEGEGPEYESSWGFGGDCLIDNLDAVTKANYICNENGMDTITMAATIACAMELYELGLITKAETGGIAIEWGNA